MLKFASGHEVRSVLETLIPLSCSLVRRRRNGRRPGQRRRSYCGPDSGGQAMQPETLYKRHTIVPLCSKGPRYKAHYKITPPGGGASQVTYLTGEFATEVGALDAALEAAKKVVDKGLTPL